MEAAYAAQQEVIDTLHEIGDPDLAARLERCMMAPSSVIVATAGHTRADQPAAFGVVAR